MKNATALPPKKKKNLGSIKEIMGEKLLANLAEGNIEFDLGIGEKEFDKMLSELPEKDKRLIKNGLKESHSLLNDANVRAGILATAAGLISTINFAKRSNNEIDFPTMLGMVATILYKLEQNNVIKIIRDGDSV